MSVATLAKDPFTRRKPSEIEDRIELSSIDQRFFDNYEEFENIEDIFILSHWHYKEPWEELKKCMDIPVPTPGEINLIGQELSGRKLVGLYLSILIQHSNSELYVSDANDPPTLPSINIFKYFELIHAL